MSQGFQYNGVIFQLNEIQTRFGEKVLKSSKNKTFNRSQPPKCYWYYHWKQQKSPPILSGLQLPLASLILSGTISLCTLASDCLYRACWKHVLIIHFFHIIVVEDQTVIEIRQVHCSCTWIIYCFVFKTVWAYIDTDMVRRNSRRLIQAAEIFNCILYREKG